MAATTTATTATRQRQQILLAVDVGSSSIRCTAYDYSGSNKNDSSSSSPSSSLSSQNNNMVGVVLAATHRTIATVDSTSGHVLMQKHNLLSVIDECVAIVVEQLQVLFGAKEEEEEEEGHNNTTTTTDFVIVAVGFSCLVMHLIGVDIAGEPVDDRATLSYAVSNDAVVTETQVLTKQLGAAATANLYRMTGAPLHASYALPQFRVLYKTHPALCAKVASWQSLSGLWIRKCQSKFTPPMCIPAEHNHHHNSTFFPLSYSQASWTGLLNWQTCHWEPTALQLLPEACRRALPIVCDNVTHNDNGAIRMMMTATTTTNHHDDNDDDAACAILLPPPPPSSWLHRLRRARFFLGWGDGACANVGSKCTSKHRVACTVGTSAAARLILPIPAVGIVNVHSITATAVSEKEEQANPFPPPGLFCYRVDRNHVLVGGALTDGGSVVAWLRQLLNLGEDNNKAWETCLAQVARNVMHQQSAASSSTSSSAAADNATLSSSTTTTTTTTTTTVLPFLSGERSTGFRSRATGVVSGLTHDTTAADLVQASMQGVALRLAAIVALLQQTAALELRGDDDSNNACAEPMQIIASGKALERNAAWRYMVAQATGLPVVWDETTQEGTSRGVAVLMAAALTATAATTTTEGRQAANADDIASSMAMLPVEPLGETLDVSKPDESVRQQWQLASDSQEGLLDSMTPLWTA